VYKDDYTEDWTVVSDISSILFFNVNYSAPISINSEITIFDNSKKEEVATKEFINGDEYTCTVCVINNGENDYVGGFLLSLIDANGDFIQKIDSFDQREPLKPNVMYKAHNKTYTPINS
jgi:hypothetical protein